MRKFEAIANLILLGPMIGLLLAGLSCGLVLVAPRLLAVLSVSLCVAGTGLVLAAKISVFRMGLLVSFGSSRMSPGYRLCYRLGYVLIGLGAFLAVGILWNNISAAKMAGVAR